MTIPQSILLRAEVIEGANRCRKRRRIQKSTLGVLSIPTPRLRKLSRQISKAMQGPACQTEHLFRKGHRPNYVARIEELPAERASFCGAIAPIMGPQNRRRDHE